MDFFGGLMLRGWGKLRRSENGADYKKAAENCARKCKGESYSS